MNILGLAEFHEHHPGLCGLSPPDIDIQVRPAGNKIHLMPCHSVPWPINIWMSVNHPTQAKETAQNWRRTGTVWTDGSRLDSGAVGAACAWQTEEGWTGRRFHLGTNKEVFDAEVYAIYQALRVFEERGQTGRKYTVFSDCQPAIRRALSDALGPGQQWARAIIEVAT